MKAATVVVSVAAGLLLQCATAVAAAQPEGSAGWSAARDSHFEVYSQSGAVRAKWMLLRFEELRSCLDQTGIFHATAGSETKPAVRVLEFASKKEYEAVQLRPTADAYYSAYGDRDYIVMPVQAHDELRVAAHEYAHSVVHAAGLKLPHWLNEGLAEVLSTVTYRKGGCEWGGSLPAHLPVLARHRWLSGSELLAGEPTTRTTRGEEEIFYAESWAVTDMLLSAPAYATQFARLVDMINSGVTPANALTKLYGKTPEAIVTEAREWILRRVPSRRLVGSPPPEELRVEDRPVEAREAQAIIADLFLTNGEWDRAEHIFVDLLSQSPNDADVLASMGTISLRKGEPHEAVKYWGRAIDAGINNAAVCYQFAVLADEAGVASEEIGRALERAITLRPDFDQARFKLALLKSNEGDYAAAVGHLQAITGVPTGREFSYWAALAYALTEAGKRSEAQIAVEHAKQFAHDSTEYARAAELGYLASTDMSVRFTRDADGRLQLTTTRIPHGSSGINPFIEAQDNIRIDSGYLQEVQCRDGKVSGFLISGARGTVTLSVPDPTHILIRNGPAEFYCGSQKAVRVTAEYATTGKSGQGLLRGLEF